MPESSYIPSGLRLGIPDFSVRFLAWNASRRCPTQDPTPKGLEGTNRLQPPACRVTCGLGHPLGCLMLTSVHSQGKQYLTAALTAALTAPLFSHRWEGRPLTAGFSSKFAGCQNCPYVASLVVLIIFGSGTGRTKRHHGPCRPGSPFRRMLRERRESAPISCGT